MTACINPGSDLSKAPRTFHAEFDADDKLIRVGGHGFCDQQMLEAFLMQLKTVIAGQHRFGAVRVLVDGREMVTQSADVVNRMQAETGKLYRAGDRVAVLISSALFKMQLERSVADDFRRMFVSEDEAKRWLAEA